ncbi:ABC transporter substrate-binding protein [Ktedonosporobacter rubrisoli]|uniref:ABC transporter substrate-binding protein n=1 Tax=Ktedonosporobacter rubrisoli TaxID=2509675 RepID=A0A4P6K2Q9_KTERU|nr:ABC transporter substrate-binding protein [Ktedonosporobacter rubrisoli]QBD82315.1 ABC transporter substrate-binding protein [Ktedonosporobacter rubrisoli]
MLSRFSDAPSKRAPLGLLFLSLLVGLSLLVAACGSNGGTAATTGTTPTAKPSIAAPTDLITAGTLTVGSDTTYPPQEFVDTATGQATGFDIDLITEIAQRMGLKVDVKKANFNTIIDDLNAKRYDVVISAVTINDERKQKAELIPYFNAGQSLLVQKGNPEQFKSIKDLCGKTAGVQDGTVELDALNAASKDCTAAGKQAIHLTVLKDQTDVIQLLLNKRVVATYQDSPVTDYYLKLNPGQFEVAGSIVNAAPEGIALRKGDSSMIDAVQAAFKAIKADGSYDKLFAKWQLNPVQKIALTADSKVYA